MCSRPKMPAQTPQKAAPTPPPPLPEIVPGGAKEGGTAFAAKRIGKRKLAIPLGGTSGGSGLNIGS